MQKRYIIPILAILIVPVIYMTAAYNTDNELENAETAMFSEIKPWDIKSLEITDKDNNTLYFKRKNCVWTVGDEALASNEMRVTGLADHIIGAKYAQHYQAQKEILKNFNVSEESFNYQIEIGLPEGQRKTLYVGITEDDGSIYARTSDSDLVFRHNDELGAYKISMDIEYWLLDGNDV